MNSALWLTPVLGALIGWFTNYLAIKMIFRPQQPVRVPVLGLVIQGVVPKRKPEIARSLGEIVARDLVTLDDLAEQIVDNVQQKELINRWARQINEAVVQSLPNLTPEPVKIMAGNLVGSLVSRQGPRLLREFTHEGIGELKKTVDLAQLVEQKVNEMDWGKLEQIVLELATRELKHIEVLGAVIGFLIGFFQLALAYLLH